MELRFCETRGKEKDNFLNLQHPSSQKWVKERF